MSRTASSRLLDEYPAITAYLESTRPRLVPQADQKIVEDVITAKLRHGNPQLMWRKASNAGFLPAGLMSPAPNRQGESYTREETAIALIGRYENCRQVGRFAWPTHAKSKLDRTYYVRDAFLASPRQFPARAPWADDVEVVVWISDTCYFRSDPKVLTDRRIEVTVFKRPADGWVQLAETAPMTEAILDSDMVTGERARSFPGYAEARAELEQLAERLYRGVYLQGWREIVARPFPDNGRGHAYDCASVHVGGWRKPGQEMMIALRLQELFLGVDYPDFHVTGVQGRLSELAVLVDGFIAIWQNAPLAQREDWFSENLLTF